METIAKTSWFYAIYGSSIYGIATAARGAENQSFEAEVFWLQLVHISNTKWQKIFCGSIG